MTLTPYRPLLAGFLIVIAGLGIGSTAQAGDAAGQVYLAGCVHRVGAVDLPGDKFFTVAQVIALGGGPTGSADLRQVNLVRMGAHGTHMTIVLDILDHDPLEKQIQVMAGDVIVVPERL
jgi:protein involved in polysaccharide export with SLBB domain